MKPTCRNCNRQTVIVLPESGVKICTTCDLTPTSSIPILDKRI